MEVKPVLKTEEPCYPKKEEVGKEHIKESVPKRWAACALAAAALCTLVSLGGCGEDTAQEQEVGNSTTPDVKDILDDGYTGSNTIILDGKEVEVTYEVLAGEPMRPSIATFFEDAYYAVVDLLKGEE